MIEILNDKKNGLQMIADLYGGESQKKKAVEEMAELTKAICKNDAAGMIEEIADVTVMMEQLVYLLDCQERVEGIRFQKIEREIGRMKEAGLLEEE